MTIDDEIKTRVCPFMSRPAEPALSEKLCEIHCLEERCMAWVDEYRTHEGTVTAHCRMLQFWAAIPCR